MVLAGDGAGASGGGGGGGGDANGLGLELDDAICQGKGCSRYPFSIRVCIRLTRLFVSGFGPTRLQLGRGGSAFDVSTIGFLARRSPLVSAHFQDQRSVDKTASLSLSLLPSRCPSS